jgi:uncharacterized peroxidase-related enzyme
MSFLAHSTNFKGLVDVFMHDPAGYLPFTQLMAAIMDGESTLTSSQREQIALHVSALNDCHYCVGSHRAVLASLGEAEQTITDAEAGRSSDAKTRAGLEFAAKLTRQPGTVAQSDIDQLRSVGWSDQAVEDIIKVVSLFSFLNRLVDGLGIKGSAEVFIQGGQMIAEHGYGPVVQMVQDKVQ